MNRAFRLALPLALIAALVPASAHSADEDDPCRLAEDAPAYVCAGGGLYRSASAVLSGRGTTVMIYGFEVTGPWGPSTEVQRSGACLLIYKARTYVETCDVPFDVVVDPLLESATITGSSRVKPFGLIKVNLTISAASDPTASAGGVVIGDAGCDDISGATGAGGLSRGATATGTVTVGKATLQADGGMASMGESTGVGGVSTVSIPCAQERARGESDSYFFVDCLGSGVEGVAVAAACNGSFSEKLVTVTTKARGARIRITASESASLIPQVDPTWIDPSLGVVPRAMACMHISTTGYGFGICGGPNEVEMDPLLRTTHIKGEFPSPFGYFGPGFGPPGRVDIDYGNVKFDLTVTPDERGAEVIGKSHIFSLVTCDGPLTFHHTNVMQGDGAATGYIVFKKRFGSFRGNEKKGIPATMDWGVHSLSAAFMYPDGCGHGEQY